jgi:hypothetical protein
MKTDLVKNVTWDAGVRNFGPFNLPDGSNGFTLELSRDNWPAIGSDVVKIKMDLSMDGGSTWIDTWVGFSTTGGDLLDRQGAIIPTSNISRQLPPGTGRKIRVEVTTFATISTTLSISLI